MALLEPQIDGLVELMGPKAQPLSVLSCLSILYCNQLAKVINGWCHDSKRLLFNMEYDLLKRLGTMCNVTHEQLSISYSTCTLF